jgi:hypothetical protein
MLLARPLPVAEVGVLLAAVPPSWSVTGFLARLPRALFP